MGQASDACTFSPTSAYSVVRLFLACHLLHKWKLASVDVSDAYLTVPQQEILFLF